jgi:hypothetical protein
MIESGHMWPALEDRGVYFVSAVLEAVTAFRLPIDQELTADNYAHIFHTGSYAALLARFQQGENKQKQYQPTSMPRRTRRRVVPGPPRYSPARAIDFGFADAGIRVQAPVDLVGPDANQEAVERGVLNGIAGVETEINRFVNQIWQDFLRDLIQVAPLSSQGGPYCTLTAEEKESANEDLYRRVDIPFRRAIIKWMDTDQWDDILFNRFFPSSVRLGKMTTRLQHWPTCIYWGHWGRLMREVPSQAKQETIRGKLLEQFRRMTWMPMCSTDRIWMTGRDERGRYIKLPDGETEVAPKIALNGRTKIALQSITLR